jgi:hypothetical protein
MPKTDKRLFLLVTTLICLSIAWFAQFSRIQHHRTFTDAVVQMLDAMQAENAESGASGSVVLVQAAQP